MNRVEACGVMAVVRIENTERGKEITRGCLQGGVDMMEISYTFPNVGDVITALNHEFGKVMLVGTGTILDAETRRMAVLAGTKFVITPNFGREAARMCNRYQISHAPDCIIIIEMLGALEVGTSYIETFPISNFYGPQLAETTQTSTPEMPLMASGGAGLGNPERWLESGTSCVDFGGLLTNGTQAKTVNDAVEIRHIVDIYREWKQGVEMHPIFHIVSAFDRAALILKNMLPIRY